MPFDSLSPVNESPVVPRAATLGASVREARRSMQLSQRALAQISGIDIATVQGLERGKGTLQPLFSVLNSTSHRFVDHDQPQEFGRWIALKRKAAGLSQDALAARIGVSKPTIIQIERGRGNISSLLRLFDALAITPMVVPDFAGALRKAVGSRANFVIFEGDNLDHLKTLADNSVDSVVTDPPYGLSYLGKGWDGGVPSTAFWTEVFRVLKPGGYLLSCGGSRTYHRMVVNVEDAGFDIQDQIAWLYGTGFAKSRSLSKDMDRMAGAKREVIGRQKVVGYTKAKGVHGVQKVASLECDVLADDPITPEAAHWKGFGTAIKPAQEPIVVARKPHKGTIAANVLKHGVGGLNIDACRGEGGRFPANTIHDGSDEVLAVLDNAHFFYCAKPSPQERRDAETSHVTVKPIALMRYLVRLVTPVGGITLDPFAGSGSTGAAAIAEGMDVILMERDPAYAAGIRKRLARSIQHQAPPVTA